MCKVMPSKAEVMDVRGWRPSTPEDELRFLAWMKAGEVPGEGTWWMSNGEVRPSDLYCYLKARFGSPMGLLSILRDKSTSANIWHWHFHVSIGQGRFEAMSSNRGTEFRVRCAEALSERDQLELLARVKADFGRVGAEMGRVRGSLESWTLFVNPFVRLNRLVSQHYEDLLELEERSGPPSPPLSTVPSAADIQEFYAQLDEWAGALRRSSQLAFTLQMLAPVLGEAFLNLLMLVLANDDLRRDKTLYEARIRDQIHIRLRGLHQMCRGFRAPLDPDAVAFKAFHSLMNRRNDLLHGNVDPLRHQFDQVFFEGTVPVFPEEYLLPTRLHDRATASVRPSDALDAVEVVTAFVLYVFSYLEEDSAWVMERVMVEEYLGWRADTGRVGVLFPEAIAFGFATDGPVGEASGLACDSG